MKHFLFILFCSLLFNQSLVAQCYCEDCPELIINGAPSTATLNISGASNNILGMGGQSLINVGVHFNHDAAQELSLRIVAPDGSFVDLTIGEGLDFGQNNNFDLNFVQCGDSPMPDCTNNPTWTSVDEWDQGPYTGSYFPESGCLEDLTGNVNGLWTLEMEDVFFIEDGELYCFDLTFADDTGISCNSAPCDEIVCLAQAGSSISPAIVDAPVGDPSLVIDYTVTFQNCEFPPSGPEYVYVFIIFESTTDNIVEVVEGSPVDMTAYPDGTYFVRGYSILASDLPVILALDFPTSTSADLFFMIEAGTICADYGPFVATVNIGGCVIDFSGTLESAVINAEVGDPALDPDWTITWVPSAPDFGIWGVYYVVYDQVTGVILDYLTLDDFTGLIVGDYNVSILLYNLSDEAQIPPANGANTFSNLEFEILIENICGFTFGSNQLFISEPCTIDINGTLEFENILAPEGDPSLDPDWAITFTGSPPDPTEYGFYFIVVDVDTDLLIAYYTTDDFTLLLEGNYIVRVIYYDLDLALLPPANGTNTYTELATLINSGNLCAQMFGLNALIIWAACDADAGFFISTSISVCEGNDVLPSDLIPQYSSGGPNETEFGYTYVISQNGIILEINATPDFTGYVIGEYEICGLSYLLTDESLLPSPDGILSTADILIDISNNTYCADLTIDCISLTIVEAPMPIFTGPDEACIGVQIQYVVDNFNGDDSDYLYSIDQGGYSMFTNNGNGTIDVIWTAGPGNICVTQSNEVCEIEACIAVNVSPLPEFTIIGIDAVCQGEEYIYTFNPPPSGSEYYDVSIIGGFITNQTVNTVTINWDDIDDGVLSAYLLGGTCDSEVVTFDVMEPAEADFPVIIIPSSSCMSTDLTIPDIDDPEILSWNWSATNADILIEAGLVNFTWLSDSPTEICLEIMTFCGVEEMCYDVDVLQIPNAINLTTLCDGESYTVEFDIEGGTAPYFVNGEAMNDIVFTSMPILSGDGYSLTIIDAEGCMSDEITGTVLCNCDSGAGIMGQDPIEICAIPGADIIGAYLGGATLEGNDSGQFVLHTNASNVLGTILALNNNPIFTYENAFGVNVTLYISHIVGDDDNGNVDQNDDCLSVSLGQPVVISDLIKVDAGIYTDQCDFSVELSADDMGFAGTWAVINAPLDAVVSFENTSDASSTFETDLPGSYSLSWTPSNAQCVEADTATFELNTLLVLVNSTVVCDADLEFYAVDLEVSGGVSPYLLDGAEVDNIFTSPSIATGQSYSFSLLDSRGCELVVDGSADCSCTNAVGTMEQDTLKGCVTDTLFAIYNEDAILDENDVELFVLHTSPDNTLGAVFAISFEPIVTFVSGLIAGNVYYLSHIIGNAEGPGIDYEDPCLMISIGQPVIFNAPPEVEAGEDQSICGLTINMNGTTSELTTTWIVIQTPFGAIVDIDENDLNGELTVTLSGEYILVLESNNGFCAATDTVSITFIESITYEDLIVNCFASGYTVSFTVQGGSGSYLVDGEALVGNNFESELIAAGELYNFIISDSEDCPEVIADGFDTCACENDAGTMTTDLIELCIDETIDLNALNNNDAILDDSDIRYHVIHTSPTNELGDVLGYGLYVPGIQELMFLDFPFEVGVTYYISTVLANMDVLELGVDDPCIAVAEGTPIIWREYNKVSFVDDEVACVGDIINIDIIGSGELPFEITISDNLGYNDVLLIDQENFSFEYVVIDEAILTIDFDVDEMCFTIDKSELAIIIEDLPIAEVRESIMICNDEEIGTIVDLDDLLISGYNGGRWVFDGNEIQGSFDFNGFAAGEYKIEYLIESVLCSSLVNYEVTVFVAECDCPMFDYASENVACFGDQNGSISILVSDGVDIGDFVIFLNEEEIGSNPEISDLAAGDYLLEISDGNDCVVSFEIIISEPAPVQISLGDDMDVEINDPVVIEAITNLIAQEIEGITWESLSGILEENDLLLNTSFQSDDIVSINIVDENGCSASDDIMVRVTFSDFVIPNVINSNSTSGNDVFRIYNTEGIDEIVSMSIYDRWGNLIFDVGNVDAASELAVWDGRSKGQAVNPGVYIYRLSLMVRGEEVILFGDLTVL